jgi:hypothetical protein
VRQVILLERIWGTTDEECRTFIHDLYRQLYGEQWDEAGRGAAAGPLEVGPDHQEIVVDAEDFFAARLAVARAAMAADPAWRRLYRFAEL